MDKIRIKGGKPLSGKIVIGGAKNSALPLMAASLLSDDALVLSNVPYLADITTMANLLVSFGTSLTVNTTNADSLFHGREIVLKAKNIKETTAPYDIVRKMRASVIVLGPLLARFGHAKVSLPGGCAIGSRPIDLHLSALEKMGAKITLSEGYIEAEAKGGLKGAEIKFSKVSVGATENILMAAALAEGVTIIKNAAKEPEIEDLANCLNQMGAKISGIGSSTLKIEGVEKLNGTSYRVMEDRIEAGTYAIAAAITKGNLELIGAKKEHMAATIKVLKKIGVKIEETSRGVKVSGKGKFKPVNISTAPYPDFATDMQAQITALLCLIEGKSKVAENIFENRFMHIPELVRMGANIKIDGHTAIINGIKKFNGAEVMATDLRASVCLVLAALACREETFINRVYHIDRGYERIEEKLSLCGAEIERIKDTI